jgi:O-antigen ligase
MFEAKPVTGWGFGNIDLYDRQFQGRVGELFVPDKDHASHNLYLTILAEQGLIGIVLYLGPVLILLAKTPAAYRALSREGPTGRSWLVVLWLIPAMHFVVNNFSNMKVPFGLGLYWLSIGLIAGIVLPRRRLTDQPPAMALLGLNREPS